MTDNNFCDRVRAGETVYGGWANGSGPFGPRAMALAGLDYVVVDLQHGGSGEYDLAAITTAVRQAGCTPLGRVRHAHMADIGRALDLGCEGVIVPNVESAEQAAAVVAATRYPPEGFRSAGGTLATTPLPLCIVMVESRHAMDELPAILRVPSLDGIYVGPRDLSYSLGAQLDPGDPVLRPALERIWAECAAAGKPVGVHASDAATARIYRENGCRLVTIVADMLAVTRMTAAELAVVKA